MHLAESSMRLDSSVFHQNYLVGPPQEVDGVRDQDSRPILKLAKEHIIDDSVAHVWVQR